MIVELAVVERAADEVLATESDLRATLFAAEPRVFCLIAEDTTPDLTGNMAPGLSMPEGSPAPSAIAGMAIWFLNYSTWHGRHGIYVEDLYVRPQWRGRGVGTALLAALAAECQLRGYSRLQWWVLDWNEPAIEFYRRINAEAMSEWTVYRVSGPHLSALAGAHRG